MSLRSAVGRIKSSRAFAVPRRRCYSDKVPSPKASFPIDPLLAEVLEYRSTVNPATSRPKGKSAIADSKINLPPLSEWRQYFPASPLIHHRVSVRNPEAALAIAEAFVPNGSKDKVIIESFPGMSILLEFIVNMPE
jgi:transcription factor 1